MGPYLSKAKTDKSSAFGGDVSTVFGLTSMQGWRQTMEDAHIAEPRVEALASALGRNVGVYGVFDGHGGPAVSAWIAKHLIPVLEQELRKMKDDSSVVLNAQFDQELALLSEALCSTFIQLDEQMQTPHHLQEIKELNDMLQLEGETDQIGDVYSGDETRGLPQKSFLQAVLGNHGKSIIQLVEQNGEQYIQVSQANEDNSDAGGEEDNGGREDEAILEDDSITAPPVKSPLLAAAMALEELDTARHKLDSDPDEFTAAEQQVLKTAVHNAELAAESPDRVGSPPDEVRQGVPETCGAAVVVCAIVEGDPPFLVTANAGDSRCVLCRAGVAVAQSHDHKPHLLSEMIRIKNAGGKIEHGRVDGNLNLSRTLGDLFYKRNRNLKPEEQKITAYPDVIITSITPQDEFVILACDGIWDCLTNQGACDFVKARLGPNPTPEDLSKICEQMCDTCLAGHPMDSENGIGCDNMTCIIVMLTEDCRKRGVSGEAPSRYYKQTI